MKYEYKTHALYRGYGWIEPLMDSEDALIADYLARRICEELNSFQAENERLRDDVAEWKRVAVAQAELQGEAEERAERLVEVLKDAEEYIDMTTPSWYNSGQRMLKKIRDLMRDHEEGE